MKYSSSSFGDFKCTHCHILVSSAHFLSGVNNRNHCPYCLWSCHLDLHASGDRLSACKGQMKPIGLTMKNGRNKYRLDQRGELMLVHECIECGDLSINRIAADDDLASIMAVFQMSMESQIHARCEANGIRVIKAQDENSVYKQLYGDIEVSNVAWSL
jgi:RNHCP domain-containing protein